MGYSTPKKDQDPNARLIRIGLNSVLFAGNPADSSPHQEILSGLLEELGQSHYDTVIIPPHVVSDQQIPYDEAMRSLNLDCAFINGLKTSDPYFHQLQTTSFPTVCWDMHVDNPNVHCIGCDSMQGMRLATEHLISLGHKRIGFICGHKYAQVSMERLDGYILALIHAGIPYDPSLVYYGDFTETAGVLGFHSLIAKNVTGLVCISDVTAIGASRAAIAMGYEIPRDLSIVGYDDAALTAFLPMGLTSVNQSSALIGKAAATMLRNIVRHRAVADVVIQPHLTIRGSTAAPREKDLT